MRLSPVLLIGLLARQPLKKEMQMKYKDSRSLEMAIKAAAKASGTDTNKAIERFYFDRFLCRVFSEPEPAFVLKGGQSKVRPEKLCWVPKCNHEAATWQKTAAVPRAPRTRMPDSSRFATNGRPRFELSLVLQNRRCANRPIPRCCLGTATVLCQQ